MNDLTSLPCTSVVFAGLIVDILQRGVSLRLRAHGSSMQPLLREGDILLVRPVEADQIRVGDVVLCSTSVDRILAHRVLRRKADRQGYTFLVQGDQAAQPDGWIPQCQVYGRVASIERAGVHIDVRRPGMRLLSWLAVLRSRGQFGGHRSFELTRRLVKRLPVFFLYLS